MPVKAPVINATGLLVFRILIQFSLPAKHGLSRREAHKPYKVSPEGTSVIGQVGTAGVFAKDFIS
jgi:hypothetical protein